MGNTQGHGYPEAHVRIYKNLLSITSPRTRAEMIQTLLQGPEYVQSFRLSGIYGYMLQYVSRVSRGENPGPLPGEGQQQSQQSQSQQQIQQQQQKPNGGAGDYSLTHRGASNLDPYQRIMKGKGNEKALSYFQTCLQVLGLEEEVALTEEELKKAYKKAAIKAHPDKKGGSEQHFEAVTRAYAYLTEILGRIQGGRSGPLKNVGVPEQLTTERSSEAEAWKTAEPVRLDAKNLDMNAFNKMFEQTRMPEPDEDGYGDWLKEESKTNAPSFSGKFNRDVFNSAFEQEAARTNGRDVRNTNALSVVSPQAMLLAPTYGVELGRDKPADFTAPANADQGLMYTDLRAAYSTENTFSGQVSDVRVEARDFGQYQESRKRAPDPLRNDEMAAIQQMEREAEEREKHRQIRAAQEVVASDEFRKRMSRLVITDGVPVNKEHAQQGYGRRR